MTTKNSDNGYLTRDQLSAWTVRRYKDCQLPEVGKVRIQSLTQGELSRVTAGDQAGLNTRLIAACWVDGRNLRIWSDDQLAEIEQLDALVTVPLLEEITAHLSGSTVEETGKNLSPTSVEGSP